MKHATGDSWYRKAKLPELLVSVAEESDADALNEVLSRRKLFAYESQRLLFSEFLICIIGKGTSRLGETSALVDSAYDATVDKFANLPGAGFESAAHSSDGGSLKQKTIDCRNYYRAILAQLDRWRVVNPTAGKVDEELAVAAMFQRIVVKHFYLSLKECRRSKMPFAKRYSWTVNGRTISLRRPVEIPAGEFKKWLEDNISDPNPSLLTERNRIQTLVDKHFSYGSFVPWDEQAASQVPVGRNHSNATSEERGSAKSSLLATTVANEKVERIETMRPAIRELGKKKLFLLVTRIFADMEDGIVEDTRIANDFGLTKATYSRFAGSDWSKNIDGKDVTVPDLWLNTAEVLSTSQDFMEVAVSAGVLPKLKKVLMARRISNA